MSILKSMFNVPRRAGITIWSNNWLVQQARSHLEQAVRKQWAQKCIGNNISFHTLDTRSGLHKSILVSSFSKHTILYPQSFPGRNDLTLELLNSVPFQPKGIQTSVIFPQRITKWTEIFNNLVSELWAKYSKSLEGQSLQQYHCPNLMWIYM